MNRLLSQTVARNKKPAPRLVVEGKCEHASKLLNTVCAMVLVKMNDNLSIAVCVKAMTVTFKLAAKLRKVINLSVKHHPDRSVLIENRLVTA